MLELHPGGALRPVHYARSPPEPERREDELSEVVSVGYVERMKKGVGHWVEGGRNGHLVWGIFHFRR